MAAELGFSVPRDQGWSMVVDGRPTETLTVNYGFIGVELDRGPHVIELSFRPPGLLPGAIAGLVAAVVLIAASVIAMRARRRPTPS